MNSRTVSSRLFSGNIFFSVVLGPTMQFATLLSAFLFSLCSLVAAGNHFYGIAASNSESGQSTYTCRTQADVGYTPLQNVPFTEHSLKQWGTLAQTARSNGFSSIFITGFDCNALTLASQAAQDNDLTVIAAIYIAVRDTIHNSCRFSH